MIEGASKGASDGANEGAIEGAIERETKGVKVKANLLGELIIGSCS